jgi:hypothetical protein
MSDNGGLEQLIVRMEAILAAFGPGDARRHFHALYARTTRAVAAEVARSGFLDGGWLERWDVVFADLYLRALEAWNHDDLDGVGPWRVAFEAARDRPGLQPIRHVLFGMNTHINYDLPQALITVITDEEFDDPGLIARRQRDHEHIDTVLVSRVRAEEDQLEGRSLTDHLLAPLNRRATRRFLVEARTKVWRNARALSAARRTGSDRLTARVQELELLTAARVADLVAPGQVVLKLARRGFGVLLEGA